MCLSLVTSKAQTKQITSITVSGNEKTKDFVILRELIIYSDSSYTDNQLDELLFQSKNRILNLNLFNHVEISQHRKNKDSLEIGIKISVVEKWFIWPMPFVEFSDRNFNVWGNLNFDPKRTNYGLYVFSYNLFGRNHTLKTKAKTGYNTKLGIEYRIPFLSRNTQWGLNSNIEHKSQNEVWIETRNDSLQFFKNGDNNLIKTTKAEFEFSKRVQPFVRYIFNAKFLFDELSSSVPTRDYFLNNADYQQHYRVGFRIEHDTRDNIYFPLRGTFISPRIGIELFRNTTNLSNINFKFKAQQFNQFRKKWYTAFSVYSNINTSNSLPYSDRKQLGYDEIVRGFEHYVIDGHLGFKGNAAVRYHLLDKSNLRLNFIPIKNYQMLPTNIYLELFSDGGYTESSNINISNQLPGKLLYSGGLGINTLFYNDRLLRLEYSLNSLKEGGFFVHFQKAI
ncbi:BamA/TamA family outer membrane protein [Bacteroidia bacterium]|nr:BamA/TamA family outer membrane protein [Bacteroidia bacterium]MDB4107259.1 BamA/TamA family outer membrane protein [Bacteroidia bacterium]